MFKRILRRDAELQELMCVLNAIGWGILLLCFQGKVHISPAFSTMVHFAPDYIWGIALFTFGVAGLLAYIFRQDRLRRFLSIVGVCGWSLISYFMFLSFQPVIGVITAPLCVLFSAISYIRLGSYIKEA